MTSTPFVLCRSDIESAAHYRTTFTSAAEAPVYITLATEAHRECEHPSAISPDRWGYAMCSRCSASMWSLRWVAEGVLGLDTVAQAERITLDFHQQMQGQGVVVLDSMERQIVAAMLVEQAEFEGAALTPLHQLMTQHLGPMPTPHAEPATETVSAMLNPDAPANTRRSGIPVPHMDLVEPDWTPDPAA